MGEKNQGSERQKQFCQNEPTAQQRRRAERTVWLLRIRDVWTQERRSLIILTLVLYFLLGRTRQFVLRHLPGLWGIYFFPVRLILSCAAAFLVLLYICGSPALSVQLEQLKRFVDDFRHHRHPLRKNMDTIWNYAAPALCFLTSLKAWYEVFSTDFFGVDSYDLWAFMFALPIPDIEVLLWAAISLFLWWRSSKILFCQWERLAKAGRNLSIAAIIVAVTPIGDVVSFLVQAVRSA